MAPNSVRTLWQQGVDMFEQTGDPYAEFEGGPDSLIETITDTSKGAGMTITFTPRAGFYGEPRLGSERFTSASHFDKIRIGSDSLRVDYLRWATSYDARMEELMGMRNEIVSGNNVEIGKWLARQKAERLSMTILHRTRDDNFLIAGGAATVDDLTSSDTLNMDEIIAMNAYARPRGGLPAMAGVDGQGNAVWGNVVIGTTAAITGLKFDPDYKLAIKDSDVRGDGNLQFKGGIKGIDGNLVREWVDIDHDGEGAIGTPYNPKAYLGVPITAGTAVLNITGGGSLNSDGALTALFMKYFPLMSYTLLPAGATAAADVISSSSSSLTTSAALNNWDLHQTGSGAGSVRYYVTIVNPRNTGDPTNDGKFCIYEINANDGNVLGAVRRLGPSDNTAQVQTLGGVTWNSAVNTQVHPTGSLVYLSTNKGLPYGITPMLLKAALRRGYGKERNRRGQEGEEDDFITNVYVRTVFGQAPRKRVDGSIPGIVNLKHAIRYEGWNIPIVT